MNRVALSTLDRATWNLIPARQEPWTQPNRWPHSLQGNNAFALDLYSRLRQGDGNRFVSPFSISTALAMTYLGAQDETALQIARALNSGCQHPSFTRRFTN